MNKPDSQESVILLVTAIPIPDKNGKLSGAIITLRDASDPGQIYPLVLDSIADGVFTVDKRFRITSFNKAAEQITGWTAQEVVGASCNKIFKSNICGADCI
ncbi:MAG: PAS domain S-box protein, partial [Desulfobulbaceae bacterium]|nr:PAS domain S-box protein [Desulfobulbaceae bacterium]